MPKHKKIAVWAKYGVMEGYKNNPVTCTGLCITYLLFFAASINIQIGAVNIKNIVYNVHLFLSFMLFYLLPCNVMLSMLFLYCGLFLITLIHLLQSSLFSNVALIQSHK